MRGPALVLVLLLAAACGSTPPKPAPGGGKYYADDGPPERVPDDVAAIPDAVPRDEPYHRYANRPYTVFGRTYVPLVNDDAYRERGLASWYGRKFHGQKTSSGEVYDMFAMTAAHKTLPIPSYAKVTNLKDGRSVVVRVNDRGPFHEGRVIDLSYAAAAKLGIAGPGSGPVEVERVFARDAMRLASSAPPSAPVPAAPLPAPAPPPGPAPAGTAPPVVTALVQAPLPKPATVETPVVDREPGGLYLQLGAFSSAENAVAFRDRVAGELPWLHEPIEVAGAGALHRVRLGPYRTREEAEAIADKIRRTLDLAPLITPARPATR